MRNTRGMLILSGVLLLGCASASSLPERSTYNPEPDRIGIYKIKTANDGRMAYGYIMADNNSAHYFGGFVKCNWFNFGRDLIFHETQGFELSPNGRKMLEFSTLASTGRMRLTCDIIYLVCHDCGEKVVINQ